jgi:hypothetical protein
VKVVFCKDDFRLKILLKVVFPKDDFQSVIFQININRDMFGQKTIKNTFFGKFGLRLLGPKWTFYLFLHHVSRLYFSLHKSTTIDIERQ